MKPPYVIPLLLLLALVGWASSPATSIARPISVQAAASARQSELASAPGSSASGPTTPSYRIDVSVDFDNATLRANQTTRFRNQTGLALDHVVFQVTPAFFGAFQLLETTAQGQPAVPSMDGTVLEVPLPAVLQPGATAEVGLHYQLDVPRRPGRLSASGRSLALGNWFPALAPHRGDWDRHQYTEVGDAFVTEVADFDVYLSSTAPLLVASTGRVLESTDTNFHLEALAVRDFALSLSPSYSVAETRAGNTVVRAYTFSAERSRLFAESGARFLRWYSDHLGGYPYRTLSIADVDIPSSYGGMEYPGLIFLSSAWGASVPFEGSPLDMLIGHEVAHQWFYSLVGNDQVVDPWLDEAFASYLPYYYYRDVAPGVFSSLWGGYVSGLDEHVRTLGNRPVNASIYEFPDDSPYFTIVYRQDARFLDELRQTIGDQAFRAALADTVRIFTDKLASPRAVLDIFQRHSAVNLNPLIGRYFSYGAFDDPAPANWRLESPAGAWGGTADLFIGAEFPVTEVEVWLDGRRLYHGNQNALTVDLANVEPGQYLLLVRIWDHRGAQYERAERVILSGN